MQDTQKPVASTPSAEQLAQQHNIAPQTMMNYQQKFPGTNPDALIGTILMDQQKAQPVPKPAPAIVTSQPAQERADQQSNEFNKMAGGGSYASVGEARSAGLTGDLRFNPDTNRYEQAKPQQTAPQPQQQSFQDPADAMAQSLLDRLLSRPDAINAGLQSQIKSINEMMAQQRQAMQEVNKAQQGAVDKLGIASGRSRYAMDIQQGIVTEAVTQGLQRIAKIDAEEQALISEAVAAAEGREFEALDRAYNFMQDLKKEKAASLKAVQEEMEFQQKAQMEQQKHQMQMLKMTREEFGATIEDMAKSDFEPNDEDFAMLGDMYGYSPEAAKGAYSAAKAEKQRATAKTEVELRNAIFNSAKGAFDLAKNLKVGEVARVGDTTIVGTGNMDSFYVQGDSGDVSIVQYDKNDPMSSFKTFSIGNIGKSEKPTIFDGGDNGMFAIYGNTAVPITIGTGGLDSGGANAMTIVERFPGGTKPAGTNNGWCLEYARVLAEPGSLGVPGQFNTIAEKRNLADPSIGFESNRPPQAGDWIFTNEDSQYGHIALITKIVTHPVTGKPAAVLSESNRRKGQDGFGVSSHDHLIELTPDNMEGKGGKIMGFKQAQLRQDYTAQVPQEQFRQLSKTDSKRSVETFKAEDDLRKEVISNPEYKVGLERARQYGNILASIENPESSAEQFLTKAKASGFTNIKSDAAGDLALIFSYMKLLDPGSVVREGEFATAEKAAGVPDVIKNMYNKALNGTRLTESQRAQFVNQAGKQYAQSAEQFKSITDYYTSLAERRGLAIENVIPPMELRVAQGEKESSSVPPGARAFPAGTDIDSAKAGGYQVKKQPDGTYLIWK
jgi:hypothetical protein